MNGLHKKLQALLLVLLGLVLGKMIQDLSIVYYIHKRFIPLTIAAVLLLFWLAQNLVFPKERKHKDHAHSPSEASNHLAADTHHVHAHAGGSSSLLVALIPIILGILPAAPLTSDRAFNRDLVLTSLPSREGTSSIFTVPPENRTMMDWFALIDNAEDPSMYIGQPVQLTGTVLLAENLAEGNFLLSQMLITCCVADAVPVGILINSGSMVIPPEGTWIRLEGTMDLIDQSGSHQPLVHTSSIMLVDPPEYPYITQ